MIKWNYNRCVTPGSLIVHAPWLCFLPIDEGKQWDWGISLSLSSASRSHLKLKVKEKDGWIVKLALSANCAHHSEEGNSVYIYEVVLTCQYVPLRLLKSCSYVV